MAIEVYSPHSGHPVKVRSEDLGRAIRDESGRIFYLVERSAGGGYYASLTRAGSAKDEQRYDDLAARIARGDLVPEPVETAGPPGGTTRPGARSGGGAAPPPYDATGRRRASPVRLVMAIVILVLALAAGALGLDYWQDWNLLLPDGSEPGRPAPVERETSSVERGQWSVGQPGYRRPVKIGGPGVSPVRPERIFRSHL